MLLMQRRIQKGVIHLVRAHKFPDFRPPTPPPPGPVRTYYDVTMETIYIGVRKALDPPPHPFRAVRTK